MTSERKIAANRRNAQRSSGPKTPAGKDRVSENAVTHGLTSARAVVRGEDAAEHEKLRKDVYHRWQPEGPMEETIADQLVAHFWRLARNDRAELAFLDGLVTRAAGYRSCEIEHDVEFIGGKLRVREREKEEMILEGAKDIEVTPDDIESALGASVSDDRAMKASRLLETNRRSTLRGIAPCEKQLEALQEQRPMGESFGYQSQAEPPLRPPPPVDGPRKSHIRDD